MATGFYLYVIGFILQIFPNLGASTGTNDHEDPGDRHPRARRTGETRVRGCRDRRTGPGEILVELVAIGVNFIDVYFRTGLYKAPAGLPFTPGKEGAGIVSRWVRRDRCQTR